MKDIDVTFQAETSPSPADPNQAFEMWWNGFMETDFFGEEVDEDSKHAVKAACFGAFISALDYAYTSPPARIRRFVDHVVFAKSQGKN